MNTFFLTLSSRDMKSEFKFYTLMLVSSLQDAVWEFSDVIISECTTAVAVEIGTLNAT